MLTRWRDWSNWPGLVAFRGDAPSQTWDTLGDLRREMDRLFFDFERGQGNGALDRAVSPSTSFSEDERNVTARLVLPGFGEKDVDVTVTANTLTVRAKREAKVPEGYTAHRQERAAFEFTRGYELPTKVDPEQTEARLKNGILTVTLAKAAEVQPKRIAVKG